MADYTQIITGIHNGEDNGYIVDEHDYIAIDPKTRQITIPKGFNSTVAYVGDINSQIVRFLCPETYDGHSLKLCSNHEIRWCNISSGISGVSELVVGNKVENGFILSWLIPPEASTESGELECVISIYDKSNNDITNSKVVNFDSDFVRIDKNTFELILFSEANEDFYRINLHNSDYIIEILELYGDNWYFDYDSDILRNQIKQGDKIRVIIQQPDGSFGQLDPMLYVENPGPYSQHRIKFRIVNENVSDIGTIKYQWNTAPFSGLLIGSTLDNVDVKTPTKDKILTLNTQTRNITLPAGYNTTIATQGDVGTAFVYIQCPRYIAGMDLTNIEVKKYLGWSAGEKSGINECAVTKIYSEVEKDDLVMLTWDVDENLTCDYAGNFSFELSFKKFKEDGATLEKQWYSNSNSSLLIKATLGIDSDTTPTSGEVGVFVEATIIPVVDEEELDQLIEAELK